MRILTTILASLATIAMVVVGLSMATPRTAEARDPIYAYVCCGPQCTLNGYRADYCLGTGTYSCCFET